jgi:hypothetical protein
VVASSSATSDSVVGAVVEELEDGVEPPDGDGEGDCDFGARAGAGAPSVYWIE